MLFQSEGQWWDLDVSTSASGARLRFTVGGETECMMARLNVRQARELLGIINQFIIEQEDGDAKRTQVES